MEYRMVDMMAVKLVGPMVVQLEFWMESSLAVTKEKNKAENLVLQMD
jgi:hypothetical protein